MNKPVKKRYRFLLITNKLIQNPKDMLNYLEENYFSALNFFLFATVIGQHSLERKSNSMRSKRGKNVILNSSSLPKYFEKSRPDLNDK